jgi:plasmid maintenance system antidote protein VapI
LIGFSATNRLRRDAHRRRWHAIGVPGNRIHAIVNGTRDITGDTDLRLCKFFTLWEGYFLRLQNAYRHGLAAQLTSNEKRAQEIDRLAREILGESDSVIALAHARSAAEAALDLARIRRTKLALVEHIHAFGHRDLAPARLIEDAFAASPDVSRGSGCERHGVLAARSASPLPPSRCRSSVPSKTSDAPICPWP